MSTSITPIPTERALLPYKYICELIFVLARFKGFRYIPGSMTVLGSRFWGDSDNRILRLAFKPLDEVVLAIMGDQALLMVFDETYPFDIEHLPLLVVSVDYALELKLHQTHALWYGADDLGNINYSNAQIPLPITQLQGDESCEL